MAILYADGSLSSLCPGTSGFIFGIPAEITFETSENTPLCPPKYSIAGGKGDPRFFKEVSEA